jgi:hypothetical protein
VHDVGEDPAATRPGTGREFGARLHPAPGRELTEGCGHLVTFSCLSESFLRHPGAPLKPCSRQTGVTEIDAAKTATTTARPVESRRPFPPKPSSPAHANPPCPSAKGMQNVVVSPVAGLSGPCGDLASRRNGGAQLRSLLRPRVALRGLALRTSTGRVVHGGSNGIRRRANLSGRGAVVVSSGNLHPLPILLCTLACSARFESSTDRYRRVSPCRRIDSVRVVERMTRPGGDRLMLGARSRGCRSGEIVFPSQTIAGSPCPRVFRVP